MRFIAKGAAACLIWLLSVSVLLAQDDDKGFLTNTIQNALSGAGREVNIEGFAGALSSAASFDRMTISDSEGVWLTLEDVVLDWKRSALLRGRLEVQSLTARRLDIPRLPISEGAELPDAEAKPFNLPDLPVSVEISDFSVDEINLGAPLLGEEAQLQVKANARLTDTVALVDFAATRTDGKRGEFSIQASMDRTDSVLDLLLKLSEEQGGIASRLLQLPGQPAVDMTVAGKGPLDDFVSDVAISSDGQERLAGQVILGSQSSQRNSATPDRVIRADIGGDMTALLAPRYQEFFGTDVRLTLDALLESNGAVNVSAFALKAQAADIAGKVTLNADKWPTLIEIDGTIANPDGTAILLPISGDGTQVAQVKLRVDYDAADGEAFAANFDISGLTTSGVQVAQTTLALDGTLQGNLGSVGQFLGDMSFVADGLTLTDAATGEAIGDRITGKAELNYIEGQPFRVSGLELVGTDYGLTGMAVINGLATGFMTRLDMQLKAADLSRFSAIAGREIDGETALVLKGTVAPLGGQFDLAIGGSTLDLRVGIPQADAVLAGLTKLSLNAKRNEMGTFVQGLALENAAVTLTGEAELRTDDSKVQLNARLADVSLVLPQYSGPISVTANAVQDTRGWTVDAVTDGPYGAKLTAKGLATGPNAALTFSADVPNGEPFAPQLQGPIKAEGTLRQSADGWIIDTDASGPHGLLAKVDGVVTPKTDVNFEMSLPDVNPFVPSLNGPLSASGKLLQTAEGLRIDANAVGPFDVEANVTGFVTPTLALDFSATVPELNTITPQLNGPLKANGTLRQTDEGFTITTSASGPYDLRADVQGMVTPRVDINFDVALPNINPLVPQVNGPLSASGNLRQTDEGFVITTNATGPYDLRADVQGMVTPRIDIKFDVALPNVNPLVPQVNGPLSASGTLRQTDAGFQIETSATGPYGARAAITGMVTPMVDIAFDLTVADINPLVPQARGSIAATGTLRQTEKGFFIDTNATGPYGLRAAVEGLATGPDLSLTFDVAVSDVSPFAPGVSGGLAAKGSLRQTPAGLEINTNATGPFAGRASVQGVITGPNAAVEFDVALPNVAALVEQVSGPLNVTGSARKQPDGWRIDTSAQGPAGTQATVAGVVRNDGTLNLDVNGTAPLGLTRPFIAPRNLQGQARFDLAINGPAALSSVAGTVTVSNASLTAPNLRVALEDIAADIRLGRNRAQVDMTARSVSGGQLSIGGAVTLSPSLPAEFQIALRDIVLIDPKLYRTSVSGNLRLAGPLAGGAVISGQVDVGETTVNVPSTGLTSIGDIPPITFVGAPADVIATRRKAGLTGADAGNDPADTAAGPGFGLNVTINAPNRIFVRGRGLDAELGGALTLTGDTRRIISSGRFELIRGRLDILGKRFDLIEGSVQFQGDLIPYLRFVSATQTKTGEVRVIVQGPANEPEVVFESTPSAPQDEVLAQLLFGRNIAEISAFQALQLASAVATLAGRGGGGIISSLREGFGLDDLDVTTTDSGATALRVGKYLTDNVYTDVTASSDGEAEISLNLDITTNLKAKGTVGSDGNSGIGIFFEKDY